MDIQQFYFMKDQFRQSLSMTDQRHTMAEDWIVIDEDKDHGMDCQYVAHTAWAARILAAMRPVRHVDIGSFLYFATLISAFIPMEYYDYRHMEITMDGLTVSHTDLLALPFPDNSIESLSCMHVVEHVGLGRYGDVLDPDGDLKAIGELKRVLSPGGTLLFVVPVGKPEIRFNAHRTYSPEQIFSYFEPVMDQWRFDEITPECGCFIFRKRAH